MIKSLIVFLFLSVFLLPTSVFGESLADFIIKIGSDTFWQRQESFVSIKLQELDSTLAVIQGKGTQPKIRMSYCLSGLADLAIIESYISNQLIGNNLLSINTTSFDKGEKIKFYYFGSPSVFSHITNLEIVLMDLNDHVRFLRSKLNQCQDEILKKFSYTHEKFVKKADDCK